MDDELSQLNLAEEAPEPEFGTPPAFDWGGLTFPTTRYSVITGPAGTGKTTFVRDHTRGDYSVKLCATTGIAAVNLGDAVTINSLLGYFNTEGLAAHVESGFLQIQLGRLRRAGITRLVLDEMSMLEAKALDLLITAYEDVNSETAVRLGMEPEVGLTLVGDFLQLPPVEGQFAFQATCWREHFEPNTIKLSTIHRQADPLFLDGLHALRRGDGATAKGIFGPVMHQTFDLNFDGTTVLAKNVMVDNFNARRHDVLPGEPVVFQRQTQGVIHGDWNKIPPEVSLKPGALVMILANRTVDGWTMYANGDLGEFLGTVPGMPNVAQVRLKRTGHPVNVPYHTKENTKATGNKPPLPRMEKIGEVTYMPLRLAYATTVHKSQGLTLDNVQVDITDPFWGQPAMMYVGLSRARSLDGMRLVGRPTMLQSRCHASRVASAWWS